MARVPATMRPAFVVRRNAMRRGVFGDSVLWKVVAVVVFGRGIAKKMFGRNVEVLARRRITPGHVITVAAMTPMTRRQRRRSGVTRASLAAEARAELEAAQRAS